jgi:hypothetical protein
MRMRFFCSKHEEDMGTQFMVFAPVVAFTAEGVARLQQKKLVAARKEVIRRCAALAIRYPHRRGDLESYHDINHVGPLGMSTESCAFRAGYGMVVRTVDENSTLDIREDDVLIEMNGISFRLECDADSLVDSLTKAKTIAEQSGGNWRVRVARPLPLTAEEINNMFTGSLFIN